MSDSSSTIGTTESSSQTEVRFSVRALLVLTAVVAAFATSAHFILDRYDFDAQKRMFVFWAFTLVVIAGSVAVFALSRYRAEQMAGRVLFRFTPHSYFFPGKPRFAAAAAGSSLLTALALMWLGGTYLAAESKSFWDMNIDLLRSIVSMWALAWSCLIGITYLWWGRQILICESGILVRHQLLTWSTIQRHYWDACTKNAHVFEAQTAGFRRMALIVPDDQRDALLTLLTEKITAAKFD